MSRDLSLLLAILITGLTLVLLWVLHTTLALDPGPRLADIALSRLDETGVTNPVTAVLLNYRAYDTLLELGVLLAALLGIWSLGPAPAGYQRSGPALAAMVDWIVPLAILAGGYMLWVGGHAPGGAFQAGALLGAAGVVMRIAGDASAGLPGEPTQRWLVVIGAGGFVLLGLIFAVAGFGFLTYPPGKAKWFILAIETAATVSIGVTLIAAYVGGRPGASGEDSGRP
jgi:multisubunit Na+/H+ antiporter MnhB subunit